MQVVNALSVDVEDYFHAEALAEAAPRDSWPSLPSRVQDSTHRTLDLLAESGAKATFFVLGWVAERYPELVRAIAEQGHEIACHSYWHRAVFRLTPTEFKEDTAQAKRVIEDAFGGQIVGYRAPSFSITPGCEWAFDVLAELGFTYDSSINPIRHDFYNNAGAPRVPHLRGQDLLEIPVATMRLAGQNLPAGGGAYLRVLPLAYFKWALRSHNRECGPAMVYFHPWEMDPGQPRLDVKLKSRLRHYSRQSAMEKKLRSVLNQFRFTCTREAFAPQLTFHQGSLAVTASA